MSKLPLLAVGGPLHGEFIGDGNRPEPVFVPIIPPLQAWVERPYCVHGGRVRSATDGQKHHVPAEQVARLYGLRWPEYVIARVNTQVGLILDHTGPNCLHPDPTGEYRRPHLGLYDVTIRRGRYERKAIADRGVYIYRGEE